MTENQKNLIIFIHKYHSEKSIIPSLTEMVKGINVSANNSVLRAIESLLKKGYLAQVGAKISSVIPTYKALKELGLQPNLFVKNLFSASTTPQDDLIPSIHSVGNTDSKIKVEGTQFDSNANQNIVQSFLNLALQRQAPGNTILIELLKKIRFNKTLQLTISGIVLLYVSIGLAGPEYGGLITCVLLFFISNLTK